MRPRQYFIKINYHRTEIIQAADACNDHPVSGMYNDPVALHIIILQCESILCNGDVKPGIIIIVLLAIVL